MATPPISSVALLAAPAHDRAMLLDIHDLLNKIFIRNRNQHRRCSWWKSLHAFRKQLALLLQDMDIGKKSDREAKVQARLRYWDTKLIHNWYFRFSQLLSSGPFAALAQVLMGCIARVCRISGITKTYEEIASAELKAILTTSDEVSMADRYGGVLGDDGQDWDEGVVIMREDEDEDDAE